jgi:peptidoglycan/LPS O-acetylase OafA/YrhL
MKIHIPYLDGWRGLAIVFLLIGHFFPVPGINFGAAGVGLFFVLSGFLMSRILFLDRVPLSVFYRRRFARILPSVVVFVLVVAVAWLLTGREISTFELLSAATFTNNYFVTTGPWTMPLGHIWSLSVEEHAYVLLSLLALSCRARKTRGVAELGVVSAMAAVIAVGYWIVYGTRHAPGLWLHTEVAAFGIVASGFVLLRFQKHRPALPAFAAPLLVLIGIAAYWWRCAPPMSLIIGCGAFALALNLMDRSAGLFRRMLELRALRQMGVWSFSLYLWQQPFYMLMHREGLPAPVALACALAVGVTAFYLVENPARNWLNRVLGAKSAVHGKAEDIGALPP